MPKHLVVVESPAKAKTIKKFLGKEFSVEASMGHVRDLPEGELAVDTEGDFRPTYVIPKEKLSAVKKLRESYKHADDLWIATDEDREGEAIGWHLMQILSVKKEAQVKRIVFHEITKEALQRAITSPRTIDLRLVEAQQARRILDRLVGYTLSPFLWKKVYRGLSAGRVQSVAVRFIVDREREINAFQREEYWTVTAQLETAAAEAFSAELREREGKKFVPVSQPEAVAVVEAVMGEAFTVRGVEEKEVRKNPPPPFTTSTLQQEAARKLGFSVKQTMVIAQQLYEGVSLGKGEGQVGLITYMRTDSLSLSEKALQDARHTIGRLYGREYVLAQPRRFKTRAKGAQEAHEAIRPTEISRTPDSLTSSLDDQQLKLYRLIWERTVATQMPPAELSRTGVDIGAGAYTFRATGQTVTFDGFLRVYREGVEEGDQLEGAEAATGEKILPRLEEGQNLRCTAVVPEQHFTKPPPRYTEASLVKKLEEDGIGRPSTYAPTISTIQQRGYIRKEGRQLVPEEVAMMVTDLLAKHFPEIVDSAFTAKMEQSLDDIAAGKQQWVPFLRSFYTPFHSLVAEKSKVLRKEDILQDQTCEVCGECGSPMKVKFSRYGKFLACSAFPRCRFKKSMPEDAQRQLQQEEERKALEASLKLEPCPTCGAMLQVKRGRYGPFLGCSAFPRCQYVKRIDRKSGIACPVCGRGEIVERRTRKGRRFWGCSTYPACTHATWTQPQPTPAGDTKSQSPETQKTPSAHW